MDVFLAGPRHSRYQQVSVTPPPGAEGSETTPERLEELYSKVSKFYLFER